MEPQMHTDPAMPSRGPGPIYVDLWFLFVCVGSICSGFAICWRPGDEGWWRRKCLRNAARFQHGDRTESTVNTELACLPDCVGGRLAPCSPFCLRAENPCDFAIRTVRATGVSRPLRSWPSSVHGARAIAAATAIRGRHDRCHCPDQRFAADRLDAPGDEQDVSGWFYPGRHRQAIPQYYCQKSETKHGMLHRT
jgi:hypothetical protein